MHLTKEYLIVLCPFMKTGTYGSQFPCGKCLACIYNEKRKKAGRLILESRTHRDSVFLTLTYADEHLPTTPQGGTLVPLQVRNFIRRVRRRFPDVRYFMCGEYGPFGTRRPHYHGILYGIHLAELYAWWRGPEGQSLLHDLWPYGFVTAREVEDEGVTMYVSEYVSKTIARRAIGDREVPRKNDSVIPFLDDPFDLRHPEFSRSSRRPGMGAQAIDDMADAWMESGGYERVGYMPYHFESSKHWWPLDDYARQRMADRHGVEKGSKPREPVSESELNLAYEALERHELKVAASQKKAVL